MHAHRVVANCSSKYNPNPKPSRLDRSIYTTHHNNHKQYATVNGTQYCVALPIFNPVAICYHKGGWMGGWMGALVL
jgi:hypothetical protein